MKNNTKKTIINEDVITRNMLKRLRLYEAVNDNDDKLPEAIAITNDPKFGQDVLKNQIEEFRSVVDGGTQFSEPDPDRPMESPLFYMPSKKNLVFSGTIPSLNNLKWQYKLNDSDGTGVFLWTAQQHTEGVPNIEDEKYSGLRLNKENLSKLTKLLGHYENWKKQWEGSNGMLENLVRSDQ